MSAIIKISKKIKMVIFYHKMPAYSRNFKFVVLSPLHHFLTVILDHRGLCWTDNLRKAAQHIEMQAGAPS